MDLGECTKIHDLALRADYEIASKEKDLFFELDVSALHFDTNKQIKGQAAVLRTIIAVGISAVVACAKHLAGSWLGRSAAVRLLLNVTHFIVTR